MPAADKDGKEKIAITSASQLAVEICKFKDAISVTETEDSWEKIDKALKRFTAVVRGGGCKYPDEFLKGFTGREVVEGMIGCMLTERTRLSGTALDLLSSTTRLGPAWSPLVALYFPTVLKLLTRTNKLYISRSTATLTSIIRHTRLAIVLPYLSDAMTDKSVSLRLAAVQGVQTALTPLTEEFDEEAGRVPLTVDRELLERKYLLNVESVIRIGARDGSAEVRKVAKTLWETFSKEWENRVDSFLAPLTPIIKKRLGIKAGVIAAPSSKSIMPNLLKSSAAPAKTQPAKPVDTLDLAAPPLDHRPKSAFELGLGHPSKPSKGPSSLSRSIGPGASADNHRTEAVPSAPKLKHVARSVSSSALPSKATLNGPMKRQAERVPPSGPSTEPEPQPAEAPVARKFKPLRTQQPQVPSSEDTTPAIKLQPGRAKVAPARIPPLSNNASTKAVPRAVNPSTVPLPPSRPPSAASHASRTAYTSSQKGSSSVPQGSTATSRARADAIKDNAVLASASGSGNGKGASSTSSGSTKTGVLGSGGSFKPKTRTNAPSQPQKIAPAPPQPSAPTSNVKAPSSSRPPSSLSHSKPSKDVRPFSVSTARSRNEGPAASSLGHRRNVSQTTVPSRQMPVVEPPKRKFAPSAATKARMARAQQQKEAEEAQKQAEMEKEEKAKAVEDAKAEPVVATEVPVSLVAPVDEASSATGEEGKSSEAGGELDEGKMDEVTNVVETATGPTEPVPPAENADPQVEIVQETPSSADPESKATDALESQDGEAVVDDQTHQAPSTAVDDAVEQADVLGEESEGADGGEEMQALEVQNEAEIVIEDHIQASTVEVLPLSAAEIDAQAPPPSSEDTPSPDQQDEASIPMEDVSADDEVDTPKDEVNVPMGISEEGIESDDVDGDALVGGEALVESAVEVAAVGPADMQYADSIEPGSEMMENEDNQADDHVPEVRQVEEEEEEEEEADTTIAWEASEEGIQSEEQKADEINHEDEVEAESNEAEELPSAEDIMEQEAEDETAQSSPCPIQVAEITGEVKVDEGVDEVDEGPDEVEEGPDEVEERADQVDEGTDSEEPPVSEDESAVKMPEALEDEELSEQDDQPEEGMFEQQEEPEGVADVGEPIEEKAFDWGVDTAEDEEEPFPAEASSRKPPQAANEDIEVPLKEEAPSTPPSPEPATILTRSLRSRVISVPLSASTKNNSKSSLRSSSKKRDVLGAIGSVNGMRI